VDAVAASGVSVPSARRLPTFFHGSTFVRTEACNSDLPSIDPSSTLPEIVLPENMGWRDNLPECAHGKE
jgi:hypothetical protein